jgi:hypothetical protein
MIVTSATEKPRHCDNREVDRRMTHALRANGLPPPRFVVMSAVE